MPIEVQVFLYVRNKLFCTKLLYFMPDARGCRAHALLSVEQAFLLQLQSSRISLIMSIEVQSFLM